MNVLKALSTLVFFVPTATQKTTFELRYDADGKVFHNVVAHAELTAKTPIKITVNEFGPVTAALANEATYSYVGVPLGTIASGALAWIQIGGYITDVISTSLTIAVGNALNITTGAVADAAADYAGLVAEWAVNITPVGASTTHTVILVPKMVLQN